MMTKQSPTKNNKEHQKKGDKSELSKLVEKTKKQNEVLKKIIEKINAPNK